MSYCEGSRVGGARLKRHQEADEPRNVPRVLIFESRRDCNECESMLADEGYEISVCSGPLHLLETFAGKRPDVVIYVLGDLDSDLSILSVLREASPRTPLVVLSGPFELPIRRSVQNLRPTYYGVLPLEPGELRDVVRSVLSEGGLATG